MVRALAAHVALGEAIEFSVNERRELLEGFFLAVAPGCEKLCKLVSPRLVHGLRNLSHYSSQKAQKGPQKVQKICSSNSVHFFAFCGPFCAFCELILVTGARRGSCQRQQFPARLIPPAKCPPSTQR